MFWFKVGLENGIGIKPVLGFVAQLYIWVNEYPDVMWITESQSDLAQQMTETVLGKKSQLV